MFKLFFGISKAITLAQRGDLDGLSQLLARNPSLIDQTKNGRSLLHISCQTRNYDMALMLIMRGADINIIDSSSRTPLIFCIELKAENIAQLLIERGADIDVKNSAGQSTLHLCALHGCARIANWLIDRGINLDQMNDDGETALLIALRVGTTASLSVALTCIDRRANVYIRDKSGMLPIEIAREKGFIGIEAAIKYLIEQQQAGLAPMQEPPKRPTVDDAQMPSDVSAPGKKKKSKKMIDSAMVGVAQGAMAIAAASKSTTLSESLTGAPTTTKKKKKSSVNGDAVGKDGLAKIKSKKKDRSGAPKTETSQKSRSLVCGFERPKMWWCVIS